MKYTKSNSGHLHCYALGQGSVLVSYLPHCFRIFPLYSVLKTVAIVILWKCFWILSFFCLKASSNFSSWGKCQALQNQQNVRYSLGFVVFFFTFLIPSVFCFTVSLFQFLTLQMLGSNSLCLHVVTTDRKCSSPTISITRFLSSIGSLFKLSIFREIFCDRLQAGNICFFSPSHLHKSSMFPAPLP